MSVIDTPHSTSNGVFAFCWDTTAPSRSHIEPMFRANMTVADLDGQAEEAAAFLSARAAGKRCLTFQNLFHARASAPAAAVVTSGLSWCEAVKYGYPVTEWAEVLCAFFRTYSDEEGPTPDLLGVDWESLLAWFTAADAATRAAFWAEILLSPPALAMFPARTQALTAANILAIANAGSANSWAQGDVDRTLAKVANDFIRLVITRCWAEVFPTIPCPPISQYQSADARARSYIDANGWTIPAIPSTVDNISSPACYLNNYGQWTGCPGDQTAPLRRFACMVLDIHRIRGTRGRVIPWIGEFQYQSDSEPRYGTATAGGSAQLSHMSKHGISTYLYFNPTYDEARDVAVNNALAALTVEGAYGDYPQLDPAAIMAMGTPTLTTGSLSTPYSEADWT